MAGRKEPPTVYRKLEDRFYGRIRNVWLDPVICAVFFVLAAAALAVGISTGKSRYTASALIFFLASLLTLRRIRTIRKHEKEQAKKNGGEIND